MCDNYYSKLYHHKKMMLNVVFILLLMHYSRIDDFCRKRVSEHAPGTLIFCHCQAPENL